MRSLKTGALLETVAVQHWNDSGPHPPLQRRVTKSGSSVARGNARPRGIRGTPAFDLIGPQFQSDVRQEPLLKIASPDLLANSSRRQMIAMIVRRKTWAPLRPVKPLPRCRARRVCARGDP